MPHVIVKLWPGKSEARKQRLSDAITRSVMAALDYGEDAVSVAFEEVASKDWAAQVVEPDILAKWHQLTKEPGYVPRPIDDRNRS